MTTLYDIVTCVGSDDIELVDTFINNVSTYVQNIDKIFIITPLPDKIKIKKENVYIINESIFPFTKADVESYIPSKKRSGWYLQQLLKLYACNILTEIRDTFLIIDADVYFHKPVCFFEGNIPLFNVGVEYHTPYFKHSNKLLPQLTKIINVSGICHLMPITRTIINTLIKDVESYNNKLFWKCFLEYVSPEDYDWSGASEYEILFTYSLLNYHNEVKIRPLIWRNAPMIDPTFEGTYEACHSYLRNSQTPSGKSVNHTYKVYYINLKHRTDRDEQFKTWLAQTNVPPEKIQRIDATYIPGRGHLGCLVSHINAIDTFLKSGDEYCYIFEDDYIPLDLNTYWNTIQHVFTNKVDFDIILLAYNQLKSTPTEYPFLERVQQCYTSSGYILARKFALTLLQTFQMAFRLAVDEESRTQRKTHTYCLDVYWETLMPTSKWYVFKPRLGRQIESFSDIDMCITNHGV